MSGLRELALAKLAKAGQRAGHEAGQPVSHPASFENPEWDSKNGGVLPNSRNCPAVPSLRAWDSGTAGSKPGQRAGQQAGQAGQIDRRLADARCREWQAHLMRLKPGEPLHGLPRARWASLLDDADYVFEFAMNAARDGWSTLDLFGVMRGRDAWGGIACRLRSSRSLVMSSDVARWRRLINGQPESFARGLGETVEMVPLWETE